MSEMKFDFLAESNRLLLAMRVLADVNLDEIVATIDHADAIGPFIDPMAYMEQLGRGDMHAVGDLARSLHEAVTIWNEKIAPKVPA